MALKTWSHRQLKATQKHVKLPQKFLAFLCCPWVRRLTFLTDRVREVGSLTSQCSYVIARASASGSVELCLAFAGGLFAHTAC